MDSTKDELLLLSSSAFPYLMRYQCNFVRLGTQKCLLRTYFFMREEVQEKILTIDQLMKRGWHMVNRSYLCRDSKDPNPLS